MTSTPSICVIIAAKNASATIARAVTSALAEPEVAEVIVIDDGSSDPTSRLAQNADDSSERLRIVRFDENRGPAAARNHAINISSSPCIAVLDADDFFLPGRFANLLALPDWDLVADNIVFIDESHANTASVEVPVFRPTSSLIDLKNFVTGNISRRGKSRAETGFLKPVMRRAFLDAFDLRYREELRLGEDYDLYVRALAKGARFRVSNVCGYGAVVRHNSLSGQHRTEDLRRLYEADRAMLQSNELTSEAARVIRQHERHIRERYELRHFLDLKRKEGPAAALRYALLHPLALPAIAGGILADKAERFRSPAIENANQGSGPALRYLLPITAAPAQK